MSDMSIKTYRVILEFGHEEMIKANKIEVTDCGKFAEAFLSFSDKPDELVAIIPITAAILKIDIRQ